MGATRLRILLVLLLLCLLEPLDEWLHVLEEHVAALGVAALLVPVRDGVLTNDVWGVRGATDSSPVSGMVGQPIEGNVQG